MNENRTKSDLLIGIERYRADHGCTYRQAWAAWFARAGLPVHYVPPPPAARPGPFARAARVLARLAQKRPRAARAASHRTQGAGTYRQIRRYGPAARGITDPGNSRIRRAHPFGRRLAFHVCALALALALALIFGAARSGGSGHHRQIWR